MELPSVACLQAFECVARHGNISRASVELSLTQSAVSRRIQQLESLLGVELFQRNRQRVSITDAGRLFLNDVQKLLINFKDATSRVMSCGGDNECLNLAVLPTFATRWMMPRLAGFLKEHPRATINFATRLVPFSFEQEPFDAALHYGSPNWPETTAYQLMSEETMPVCSPLYKEEHPVRKAADWSAVTLLHQTSRGTAWQEWFSMAGIHTAHPLRGPRFEQFAMITQAAMCHLGVALLPTLLIEDEMASGRLVTLVNRPMKSPDSYYFIVPESKPSSPLTVAFTQWLKKQARMG